MNTIDLSPLYRSSIGFDRFANLLDTAFRTENVSSAYPRYDIEVLDENRYAISIAVAGFSEDELDINVEGGLLTIRGRKNKDQNERGYLHKGIAYRSFERKFNLADYVEVKAADLAHGLLTISLEKEIPEAMKPRKISIGTGAAKVLELKEQAA